MTSIRGDLELQDGEAMVLPHLRTRRPKSVWIAYRTPVYRETWALNDGLFF